MYENWSVRRADDFEDTQAILSFLLDEFVRIFGRSVMLYEPCEVYNDSSAPCPRFLHSAPMRIRLSMSRLSLWSKTIFQLSHEMCHYAMHRTKKDKTVFLSWFEEIVCEAMALYCMEYASENWDRCDLSRYNRRFAEYHREYLEDALADPFDDGFKRCNSVEKMKEYERSRSPESNRSSHKLEADIIYRAISADPLALKCVLNYTEYIGSDGITIDFDRWLENSPCDLLRYLKWVQPV